MYYVEDGSGKCKIAHCLCDTYNLWRHGNPDCTGRVVGKQDETSRDESKQKCHNDCPASQPYPDEYRGEYQHEDDGDGGASPDVGVDKAGTHGRDIQSAFGDVLVEPTDVEGGDGGDDCSGEGTLVPAASLIAGTEVEYRTSKQRGLGYPVCHYPSDGCSVRGYPVFAVGYLPPDKPCFPYCTCTI